MSTPLQLISLIALLSLSTILACGQEIEVTIGIDFETPAVASIQGRRTNQSKTSNRRNLSFLKTVPGAEDLTSRISGLALLDSAGREVTFRKLQDGEYLSDTEFEGWTYEVDLTPTGNRNAAAHSSWFAAGTGILMLADLLPLFDRKTSAGVTFKTPPRLDHYPTPIWSSETRKGDIFEISAIEDAVFYVGSWENGFLLDKPWPAAELLISGTWNFDANDMSPIAKEIHDHYSRLLGSNVAGKPFIAIAKFPVQTKPGEWQAETRGRNVTIISSDMPFKTQSLQRLHEQLRHELFHLWIPNGVNLTGKYDWFYEGFALYESLKLAVELNRIRFDDFLDTLSRAHTIDSAGSHRTSLIQMSSNRFSGANTQVYARGMLVAFLCDLALLEQSKGKRSVENILQELFSKHRKPAAAADGNSAVIALLKSNPNVVSIVEKYIEGAERLEFSSQLNNAGLEDGDAGPLTNLRVKEKLNGRQKALLDKLGYNNWRKLSPTSK
jgi:hypothetical protein